MEVQSGSGYPSSSLSNFAPHHFTIDEVECSSMEGFLQALKFKDIAAQRQVCTLHGREAKVRGRGKNWYVKQVLHWQGVEYPRSSKRYQDLLDRAYEAMYSGVNGFKKALLAAGKDAVFTHTIGKIKENETILTRREFCGRLMRLKKRAFEENKLVK